MVENRVIINFNEGNIMLCLDYFFEYATLTKIKSAISLAYDNFPLNACAIDQMTDYVSQARERASDRWHDAGIEFQNKYEDVNYRYDLTKRERIQIIAANKRRQQEVKRCKSRYER